MSASSFSKVFDISTDDEFKAFAKAIERYQLANNDAYRRFVESLGNLGRKKLPFQFMPIEAFKYVSMNCQTEAEVVFTSSGTTGINTSQHPVADLQLYRQSAIAHFEERYGPLTNIRLLALLPSYMERTGSSLIWMVEEFSKHTLSGKTFFADDFIGLKQELENAASQNFKTVLIGVSFALLDFVERFPMRLPALNVIETGGMKGRRKEIVREALHSKLMAGFGVGFIGSEYGMTELLSQCYMAKNGRFYTPRWMRVFAIDISDPLSLSTRSGRGVLCFVDLANAESCSFIRTSDIGRVFEDGGFTVEGRLDNSDMRGCNLLYA